MSWMRKQIVTTVRKRYLVQHDAAIVISSMGRAGSTLLHDAVIDGMVATYVPSFVPGKYGRRAADDWATDLSMPYYPKGVVYKTHDYPTYVPVGARVRTIYTIADPFDIVLSLLKQEKDRSPNWIAQHFKHFRADYSLWPQMLERDALGLEAHFDAWTQSQPFPNLVIKYDALWDHQDVLSDFVGVPVVLPPKRERAAKQVSIPDDQRKQLEATYGALRAKVADFPAFQLYQPQAN